MEQQNIPQSSVTDGFARVYDAHLERIYRFHFNRTRHRETAEDLTSQTFLKALEGFHRFDAARAQVSTWLYRIARNALIDHLRRLHPSQDIEGVADFLSSGEDVAENAVVREAAERAKSLLQRLTPEQREIILLRLWDDLSYAEIAELTGKNEGACKMAFSRGLAALRKHAGPLALLFLLIPTFHS
jgi:RNA polymerase sigma-70 factor, ECF subfamily